MSILQTRKIIILFTMNGRYIKTSWFIISDHLKFKINEFLLHLKNIS